MQRLSFSADQFPGHRPGCACTNGYVHYACGSDYLRAKPESSKLVCEVCLAEMTNMEVRFQVFGGCRRPTFDEVPCLNVIACVVLFHFISTKAADSASFPFDESFQP